MWVFHSEDGATMDPQSARHALIIEVNSNNLNNAI
jgi:hypothetical protein